MAVIMPRENWTDQRLDDLNEKVDLGFARIEGDIRELRGEMKDLRGEMNSRFDKFDERFEVMDARSAERFEALYRILIGSVVAIVIALLGSNAF